MVASDASASQIAAAPRHPRVRCLVAVAEQCPLVDGSADALTVAQALHWFDLERFYPEAQRVLVEGGFFAAWCYGVLRVRDPAPDRLLQRFYAETLGPWWPPERKWVESGYRTLAFPFEEIAAPGLELAVHWTLPQLLGYLRSWSATARFIAAHGHDPVVALAAELAPLWGGGEREVTWPLALRAGFSRGS